MKARLLILAAGVAGLASLGGGCARFQPQPLSAEKSAAELESRSLTNAGLKVFLERNLPRDFSAWPPPQWDFDALTLTAFYYHPDLAVARAQWAVAQAGVRTAGGRPNPTLNLTPVYNTTHAVPTPWGPFGSLDVPIETAGKRGHRIAAAGHQSESARLNLAGVAWELRSRLRSSLIEFAAAERRETLLQQEVSLQEKIVALLEQQAQAGAVAGSELTAFRIALEKARLDLADAQQQRAEARVHFAAALGVSVTAFGVPPSGGQGALPPEGGTPNEPGLRLSFDPLNGPVSAEALTSAEVRRAALLSRTDILGALADYAAAEATLQLEIAKQYPDVHLNPGYEYDQGDNKWSLGVTFELPVLNQNQGPIAEAKARRAELAAKFNALQTRVLAEIERAVAVFRVSENNSAALEALKADQARRRDSIEAQYRAGSADRLDVLNAQLELCAGELVELEGRVKRQQAFAALEDAMQRPVGTIKPSTVESQTVSAKENKP